jgi:hypothetical protein
MQEASSVQLCKQADWNRISAHYAIAAQESDMQTKTPRAQLSQLRQNIIDRFSDEELRDLCADLGIEYESLPARQSRQSARTGRLL